MTVHGADIAEVGTGWIPVIPVGFWLSGARRLWTFDMNRHLRMGLLCEFLRWTLDKRDELTELWRGVVSPRDLDDRLDLLEQLCDTPAEFLAEAQIEYVAPGDATCTGLPDSSVDIHYSAYTFEHIPREAIRDILREAHRILRPGGAAIHYIDMSDHFSHADPSITSVNFLRFDEREWARYGSNRFAYHNRLRADDYMVTFDESPLDVVDARHIIDHKAAEALQDGFPLASRFKDRPMEALACEAIEIVAVRE